MKKIVLYLESIDLDMSTVDGNDIEWVDEEAEMSIVASHFVDALTDEYPSTGRMYVRTNEGCFVVRRIRDADWNEGCQIVEEEHAVIAHVVAEYKRLNREE